MSSATSSSISREMRSVKIPHHRFSPIKKVWLEMYTPLVEKCKLEVRMNLKTRSIDLRNSPSVTDETMIQKGVDFCQAVVLGFEVRDAMAMLRMEDILINSFEIKDVRANLQGDNLSRCIGRISGSHGKTRFTIENVTRTRIVLADTHIHIMGTPQNTRVARQAICELIKGSPATKIYTKIKAVMSKITDTL